MSGELMKPDKEVSVLTDVAMQREIAEVRAAMAIAKRFPRDHIEAIEKIKIVCQRPALAEGALYTYSKGGTDVTGPSIRLAEAIAQQWGNMQFGIRELEQRIGESTVEAYAWDLETNTRENKVFQVKHTRYTKKGSYLLTDPRDIYEMVANMGARRLRACILGVIPGDVVEAAQIQCEETLRAKADTSQEAMQRMVAAFAELGVTKDMLEQRIQRKLESIVPAQVIGLRKIFNSLKDGMSGVTDWFEVEQQGSGSKKTKPTTASGPQGGNGKGGPVVTAPEGQEAAGTQTQASEKTEGQIIKPKGITLPELMELVKKDNAEVELPIPLETSKGICIGRWLEWGLNLREELVVTIELLPNLPDLSNGLNKEMVGKSFKEASINLVIQEAMPEQEARRERIDGAQTQGKQAGEAAKATHSGQSTAAPPKEKGKKGQTARKSLF